MQDRDARVDALKGFLIISVVISHLPNFSFYLRLNNYTFEMAYAITLYLVYFYNTELFFASSALFVKHFSRELIKKRFVTILVPFILWFFIHEMIIFVLFGAKLSKILQNTSRFWMGSYYYLNGHLWFLPALFTTVVLFSLYHKYVSSSVNWVMAMVWLAVFIFSKNISIWHNEGLIPFGIDVFLYMFPLLVLIRYIYENHIYHYVKWFHIAIAALFSLEALFFFEPIKEGLKPIDLAKFGVPYGIFGFLAFMIICTAIFIVFMKLKPSRFLRWVGSYSMPVYLMHIYVIIAGLETFKHVTINTTLPFLAAYSILFMVSSVLLPIAISKALMRVSDKFKILGMVK